MNNSSPLEYLLAFAIVFVAGAVSAVVVTKCGDKLNEDAIRYR